MVRHLFVVQALVGSSPTRHIKVLLRVYLSAIKFLDYPQVY